MDIAYIDSIGCMTYIHTYIQIYISISNLFLNICKQSPWLPFEFPKESFNKFWKTYYLKLI